MQKSYMKKGGIATVALAFVALVAWKAPDVKATAASPAPVVATAPAATSSGVALPVTTFAPVVQRVEPAVVTIRVEKRAKMVPTDSQMPEEFFQRFFGGQGMPQMRMPHQSQVERALGSGVIVNGNGYILTNDHVVDGADTVRVELPDKRSFTAKVVGTDPATDLAVVKVDAKDLPTLPLGNSDAVNVGDVVLAVGNPMGIGETVTSGIISAKGRHTEYGDNSYQDFLQTDAAINHGNSGGALVNANGQLIGINSQILSSSDGNIGIGFAIPSNMAKNVMDQLIKTGAVHRAKLGATIQSVTADMAAAMSLPSTSGALVSDVENGSPAEHAGLKQGDVITQFNGKPVADSDQLRNEVASSTPGSTVSLQVLRHGQTETVQAKLGELPSAHADRQADSTGRGEGRFGLSVQPFTPDMADQLGVSRTTQGVVVAGVDPSGIAAESGIQEGDVILKVDGTAVRSVDQLKSALDSHDKGSAALLLVNRKGTDLFVTLRAE